MFSGGMFANISSRRDLSQILVVGLIASLLVLISPFAQESKADYTSWNQYTNDSAIVYNNQVCELGDPNDHSTSATAFEISTSEQLWEVTDCVSSSATIYFELGDNINVSGSTAPTNSPIGFSTSSLVYSFSGVLDGTNKTISGINMSTTSYGVGLFGLLHGATVSNLAIAGSFSTSFSAGSVREDSAGALAVRAYGLNSLVSLSNTADVTGVTNVGGLVGFSDLNFGIHGSRNSGIISGSSYVGGFIGLAERDLIVTSSFNDGDIFSSTQYAGGFAGRVAGEASIYASLNTGAITGPSRVGGFIGEADYITSITSSHNTGDITGNYAGGFVGAVMYDYAWINLSSNAGHVTGNDRLGGLVGYTGDVALIYSSSNSGSVQGSGSQIGGLVGEANRDVSIYSSSNSGSVQGSGSKIGGLVGEAKRQATIQSSGNTETVRGSGVEIGGLVGRVGRDALLENSYNSGAVTSTGSGKVGGLLGYVGELVSITSSFNGGAISVSVSGAALGIGGLVGQIQNDNDGGEQITVNSSYNSGSITGTNSAKVGGLIGSVAYDNVLTISLSHNSGNVSADQDYVGGLIGDHQATLKIYSSFNSGAVSSGGNSLGGLVGSGERVEVSYSYNVGSVSGSQDVGGLLGKFTSSAHLKEAYSTGLVTGSSQFDGLVGGPNTPVVTSAYASEPTSHGSAKSIAQMKIAPTYVGFSFPSVWAFGTCSENNGFPVLVAFGSLANYYSYSCGTNTDPTLGSQSASNPGASTPGHSYVGPVIESPRATAQAGSSLQLSGEKLDSIASIEIGGVLVEVTSKDATSITLALPALIEPGTYDLVITSDFGKLTVMGAVVISAAVPKASELGELLGFSWTGAFTGNSRSLNQIQVMNIESALEKQPTATTVICWGYTTVSSPNAWAIAHATQRAQAACNLVAQLNSEVKTAVRLRYGVKKSYAMRASLQFWELKPVR